MGLIGDHPSMRRIFDVLKRVGASDAPVLVTGDSGTGKELIARALHHLSSRTSRSFVPVHCGAIPEELLESELFGHVRGAFTGAIAARTGRFQLADRGTIFLDEIGEMSPRFQVKLLRVLEDGTFDPVGSHTSRHTDVRVVAATHRDLHAAARQGTFREDLLYRLDVVRIHLPALRERREDIPLIARHFLVQSALRGDREPVELPSETAAALMAYDWPGNVRELRNVLERAVLLSEQPGVLLPDDLPAPIGSSAHAGAFRPSMPIGEPVQTGPWDFGPEGTDFYHELETFERRMIGRALALAGGSKREAARLLQVNRTTLLEKLKRRGWQTIADSDGPATRSAAPVVSTLPFAASPLAGPMTRPEPVLPLPTLPWTAAEGWIDVRRPVARAFPAPSATVAAPSAAAPRASQLP
ncbi:sigma-54 dependent transcriptional regulator [Candidatus Binatia bacterium]|nr:sigma-54 dependent transcriptional regulator [Candidatus Binatia bacterium]